MKIAFTVIALILVVLTCGCTAAAPSGTPAATALPNLTGTWTGPMQGYDQGTGFSDYPNFTSTLVITEQRGRLFSGQIIFSDNGTQSVSGIAGIIGRDNRTFTITEEFGGYSYGEVLAPDEIEVSYLDDGSPYSAAIDSFKRV
jgi:hypothetical protein